MDAGQLKQIQEQQGGDAEAEEQLKAASRQRKEMLSHILDQSAQTRLQSIRLVKPEKARMTEEYLLKLASMGRIRGKVGEADLKRFLEQVTEQTESKTTVKFRRREIDNDSDVDDEDDDADADAPSDSDED